jgi:predicted deacylase
MGGDHEARKRQIHRIVAEPVPNAEVVFDLHAGSPLSSYMFPDNR